MSRSNTWGEEETRFILQIWADDRIKAELERTHRNTETFQLFAERMREGGYERTAEQCHRKLKKLRQAYNKARDAIRKTGASSNEKDKCPFYDQLDGILGTRPTSSPVRVMESTPAAGATPSADTSSGSGPSASESGVTAASSSAEDGPSTAAPRRARKRRAKEMHSEMMEEFNRAEDARQERENATLERWMGMQQEAEERRFRMLQEQQAATNGMFMNIMQTFMQSMSQQPPQPAASWGPLYPPQQPLYHPPPPPRVSGWSAQQSHPPHPPTRAHTPNLLEQSRDLLYGDGESEDRYTTL
ncbi:uncharacterized protein LOC144458762 [Epinephelus lanceolatus]